MNINIKIRVNGSCFLKTDEEIIFLEDVNLLLTNNSVLGSFSCNRNIDLKEYKMNLCQIIESDNMEYLTTIDLDVIVNFKTKSFRAKRNKDFMIAHYLDGKLYKPNITEIKKEERL